jgi:hypothetical protein
MRSPCRRAGRVCGGWWSRCARSTSSPKADAPGESLGQTAAKGL